MRLVGGGLGCGVGGVLHDKLIFWFNEHNLLDFFLISFFWPDVCVGRLLLIKTLVESNDNGDGIILVSLQADRLS